MFWDASTHTWINWIIPAAKYQGQRKWNNTDKVQKLYINLAISNIRVVMSDSNKDIKQRVSLSV